MSIQDVFDPRSELHKSPFGAAACGAKISFFLSPPHEEGFFRCILLTHHEFADVWQETELGAVSGGFGGVFTAPEKAELIWYHFRFERVDGSSVCLAKNGWCAWNGVVNWQLTVYAPQPCPKWLTQGFVYQIFPDRFCRGETLLDPNFPAPRHVHKDWDEPLEPPSYDDAARANTDFFGGSLEGITQKLDYLRSLGVGALYLNPIFLAASNHRYDTADYETIDPMLGNQEDLARLCREAHARGIRIILDGVFNHTGSNSRYFNAMGTFPSPGAAQSKDSPFYPWFSFSHWPDAYEAWWGVPTLPAVNESADGYADYIADGENSIIRRYLRLGADGWRLDVADELPDWLIERIRAAMTQEKADSFLLGEVWEDGTNKIAYSQRRRYLLGSECNALMNYPFRSAVLAYLRGGSAADFRDAMEELRENYPPSAFYAALNFLSTHDTPRILTLLGCGAEETPPTREARGAFTLSPEQHCRGCELLRLAAVLLFTFPGTPCVYYGDEAGMQGWEDPFNRATYPWGREDRSLRAFFARLGALRRENAPLQGGAIEYLRAEGGLLAFCRTLCDGSVYVVCNAADEAAELSIRQALHDLRDYLSGAVFSPCGGTLRLFIAPRSAMILVKARCFT